MMERLIDFAAGLLLTVCMITASVTVTLNFRPLYYIDMQLLSIPENSGFSDDVVRENYDRLISYNNVWNREPLVFEELSMSESGRIHFEEVKRIFGAFEIVCFATLPMAAVMIPVLRRRRRAGWLLWSAGLSFGIPAVLAAAILAGWERFFILFHELIFQNDYWLFDPVEDPVITILPDAFFLHCAVMILVLVLMGGTCCLVCYRRCKKS